MWPRGGLPYPRVLEGRPAGLAYVRPPTDMIFSGAVSRIGVGIRLTPPPFSGEGGEAFLHSLLRNGRHLRFLSHS